MEEEAAWEEEMALKVEQEPAAQVQPLQAARPWQRVAQEPQSVEEESCWPSPSRARELEGQASWWHVQPAGGIRQFRHFVE